MLGGREHANPSGEEGDNDRVIVPVNPWRLESVMIDVPDEPGSR